MLKVITDFLFTEDTEDTIEARDPTAKYKDWSRSLRLEKTHEVQSETFAVCKEEGETNGQTRSKRATSSETEGACSKESSKE